MEHLLKIQNATVRRAGKDILHVDEFVLNPGESVAILGPNGSGKSTFVNLVTREVFPLHQDDPPVLYKGRSNMVLEDLKREIGFVSSSMQKQIAVHLSALEVVCGGLFGSLGVPKRFSVNDAQRAKALATMEAIGIGDLADRDMLTLSTGQARRVLIARALVHDPEFLVFDEPTTGLDLNGMYYVRKTMADVARSGKSILLVTHYPEDIVSEIQRVIYIKDGRIVADGSREDLLASENINELFDIPE